MVEKYSVYINMVVEVVEKSAVGGSFMLVWLSISIQRLLAELRDSSLRYLASTSPHHRILKSYRRAVDVDSIASSVTSDWDKEVGNQENKHNPN